MTYTDPQAKLVQDSTALVAEIVAKCPKQAKLTFEFTTWDNWYNHNYNQEIHIRSVGRPDDRTRYVLMAQVVATEFGAADGWTTQFGQANRNPRLVVSRTVPMYHHITEEPDDGESTLGH